MRRGASDNLQLFGRIASSFGITASHLVGRLQTPDSTVEGQFNQDSSGASYAPGVEIQDTSYMPMSLVMSK